MARTPPARRPRKPARHKRQGPSDFVTAALAKAADALSQLSASFAVVGGIAVSARSRPRFTEDVDLAVAVKSDSEAERIVFGLQSRGWTIAALIEQKAQSRLATARLVDRSSDDEVLVDLIFATSGVQREVVAASEPVQLPEGLVLPTATTGHLIAMKVLSESPKRRQDRDDLEALLSVATARDLRDARSALARMTERGYARRRDLQRSLERWIRRSR